MQLTIRNVPAALHAQLVKRARSEGKSLNRVTADALARGVGLDPETNRPVIDLGGLIGSMSRAEADFLDKITREGDEADLKSRRKEGANANSDRHESVRRPRRKNA